MQYAGFTMTPLLGSLFGYLGSQYPPSGLLNINEYNLAAYFLSFLAFFEMLMLYFVFEENVREPPVTSITQTLTITTTSTTTSSTGMSTNNTTGTYTLDAMMLSIFGCLLNFVTKGTIAVYETMATQISSATLMWSFVQTGVLIGLSGSVGVTILVFFNRLARHFNDYDLMVAGMIAMCIGCLAFSINVTSMFWIVFQFCFSVAFMYSMAYPIGHTSVLAMFTKIVNSGPQGQMNGWFASAGSAARVFFPILSGILSQIYGENLIFLIMSFILLFGIAGTVYFKESILNIVLA